ncbi:MAG TPA: DUF72 domain-containing protein [Candidatus Saccharimonadia bacterium]|nr:DUF72 domain-containing protein [Candidatus Saccharimonadia bacterium]
MPARLRDEFAVDGTTLQRYASRFDCVEVNSSFYRPHRAEVYARWAESVPPGFRFSVKLPQTITHELRLRRTAKPLATFLAQVEGLGPKLGALLVQLPGSFAYDARVAGNFFRALRGLHAGPVVCEPRHPGWFEPRVAALFERLRIGRVAADPARCADAAVALPADALAYYRMHGSPRMYWSPYGRERLLPLAAEIAALRDAGIRSWCIFDNTASQSAAHDALALRALLDRQPLSARVMQGRTRTPNTITSANGTARAPSRGRAG